MATATLKQAVALKHRANLGEEAEEIEFRAGDKLTVLRAWDDRYLCKSDAGLLFNVPKEYLSLDG
jgi:hypothetical protein